MALQPSRRRPGTRATPEHWAEAAGAAPALQFAPAAESTVAIDWSTLAYAGAARPADATASPAAAKDWRQRFVTDLGRSQEAANPNAALRVFVPASASASVAAKPRLTVL